MKLNPKMITFYLFEDILIDLKFIFEAMLTTRLIHFFSNASVLLPNLEIQNSIPSPRRKFMEQRKSFYRMD